MWRTCGSLFVCQRSPLARCACTLSVLVNITDSRPKVRYLVAVDAAHNTLEEIVKAISDNLGTGRVDHTPKEEALVDKNLSVSNHCMGLCGCGWVGE